jgi:hypothetical protein
MKYPVILVAFLASTAFADEKLKFFENEVRPLLGEALL